MNVQKKKLSEDRLLTEIQCVAQGEPNNYNYFPWEHRSRFDEHIRYLAAIDVRHRQLPGVNVSNTYQNTGFYVCKVLNGIPDYHGNFLQQGRVYVEFEGVYKRDYVFPQQCIFLFRTLNTHMLLYSCIHH